MAAAVLDPPQTRRLSAAVLRWQQGSGPPVRIAIIADRRLSVAALSALLLQDCSFDVLQSAERSSQVRRTVTSLRPGLLVVDSAREASLAAIDASEWGGRVLLLVDPEESPAALAEAARSGAHGFLSLTASRAALVLALDSLRQAGSYLDPELGSRMLGAWRDVAANPDDRDPLSRREREIVVQVARGRSSKEIAKTYAISSKTVCNHIINVYHKLNLRHRGQLVLYAAQQGLTTLGPEA
jgi:DNA-binding NarL/FixJ family response regulator